MSKREKPAGAQMIDAKKGKVEIDLDLDLKDSFGSGKSLKSVGDKIIEKAPVKHDKSKQKTIDAVSRILVQETTVQNLNKITYFSRTISNYPTDATVAGGLREDIITELH